MVGGEVKKNVKRWSTDFVHGERHGLRAFGGERELGGIGEICLNEFRVLSFSIDQAGERG